jgi:thiol:disulfide interchange protein DsbC
MIQLKLTAIFFLAALLFPFSHAALAFEKAGCGAGDCRDCHALSKTEAAALLKDKVSEVLEVKRSEVPGLWDVEAVHEGRKVPLYLDFSKKYLISGSVIKLASNENLTEKNFVSMNRVDAAKIPLDDAVVVGRPDAEARIIVFSDPECSFCAKLHDELKKTVAEHPEIAFFIKLFPLPSHPNAKAKAHSIVCAKIKDGDSRAEAMLADSLAGKPLPALDCGNTQVDKNLALGKELHVSITPTLIMPDGRVLPGYKTADEIVAALAEETKEKGGTL